MARGAVGAFGLLDGKRALLRISKYSRDMNRVIYEQYNFSIQVVEIY